MNFAVFDEPDAVAGQAGQAGGSGIGGADVPETADKNPAFCTLCHLLYTRRGRACFDDRIYGAGRRLFLFLFCPETVVNQVFEDAVFHKINLFRRNAALGRLLAGKLRVPRIADDAYAFVKNLFAQTGFSSGCRIDAAALVGISGVKGKTEISEKIGYRLWFQDRKRLSFLHSPARAFGLWID